MTNVKGRYYDFINYFDVWGNEKDGYTVNNQCIEYEDCFIADDSTRKEIATFLVNLGFLNTDDLRKVYIDFSSGDLIEVYARRGMYPLGAFYPKC